MIFSTILFLWVFLPGVLIAYFAVGALGKLIGRSLLRYQNIILVLASLIFYAWGEPKYILLMIFSVLLNWIFGMVIESRAGTARKISLILCVAANLALLGYFKYFNFFADMIARLTGHTFADVNIILPIGISFYTFQALSYVIDVYRGENKAQRNIIRMTLYISFFPQLIAGPIVKYHDIEAQITDRRVTVDDFTIGVKRFIFGLGKKVILANAFAEVVDEVYTYDPHDVSVALLWLAAVLYMLQIYFDFSGYSDMAIGMGRMFGFHIQENFNLPYTSTSIREFWRRWHISLSGWFREYVYIPLGGNRKGTARTYLNLIIVFFLTGLWHGAGFTFIFWGLYHGFFSIVERIVSERHAVSESEAQNEEILNDSDPAGKKEQKALAVQKDNGQKSITMAVLGHIYTLFVVLIGWVFFRADSLTAAFAILGCMFVPHISALRAVRFINSRLIVLIIAAVLASGPMQALMRRVKAAPFGSEAKLSIPGIASLAAILWFSIMMLVNDTYNPFIYFRF